MSDNGIDELENGARIEECERIIEEEKRDYVSPEEEYFNDWFNENKHNLEQEFIEDHQDEFNSYCRERCRDFRATNWSKLN